MAMINMNTAYTLKGMNAIITGGKAPVPTEQIVINQAIIDGIIKSANLGKEIEITIPEV